VRADRLLSYLLFNHRCGYKKCASDRRQLGRYKSWALGCRPFVKTFLPGKIFVQFVFTFSVIKTAYVSSPLCCSVLTAGFHVYSSACRFVIYYMTCREKIFENISPVPAFSPDCNRNHWRFFRSGHFGIFDHSRDFAALGINSLCGRPKQAALRVSLARPSVCPSVQSPKSKNIRLQSV